MAKRNRWYDKVSVKITIIGALVSFVAGLVTVTYSFAEDQTKKGLEIDNNKAAIERIEKVVEKNSVKLDKLYKLIISRGAK